MAESGASFSVGNYSDLIDNLNDKIASGTPKVDFSTIGDLPKTYWEGLDQKNKQEQRDAFKDGMPTLADGSPDWSKITSTLLKTGGTGSVTPAVEIGKMQTQRDLVQGLQRQSNAVFGGDGGPPPQSVQPAASAVPAPRPAVAQAGPQSSTPNGGYRGGDGGNSIAGIVQSRVPAELAGPLIAEISARAGVDANAPLTDPNARAKVAQVAQQVIGQYQNGGQPQGAPQPQQVAQPQITQPQQSLPAPAPGISPSAALQADPSLGGLVPPNFVKKYGPDAASQYLQVLKNSASLAQSTGVRDAGKAYLDTADAIQKALTPTNENKNFQTARLPGESMTQWEARVAREKAIAGETGKAIGGQIADYIDQGRTSNKRIQQLDVMRDALERGGGKITTGPFADVVLKSKQALASMFGIQDLEGLAPAELVQKVGFGLATSAVKEISSRPAQMEFLKGMENNPGLLLSPRGSLLMMDILRQSAVQDRELAKLAANPANHANWPQVSENYYNTHPLKSPFDKTRILGARDLEELKSQPAGGVGSPGGAPGTANAAQPQTWKGPTGREYKVINGKLVP